MEGTHDISTTDEAAREEFDALVTRAYQELRAMAHHHVARLARRGGRGSLDTTALVHETWLKLAAGSRRSWRDREHFLAVASVAMRHLLVDRARARAALRRGGNLTAVSLGDADRATDDAPERLIALDSALDRLATIAPRLARVVELRFFGGLSEQEVAEILTVTVRTVQRDWTKARALLEELTAR